MEEPGGLVTPHQRQAERDRVERTRRKEEARKTGRCEWWIGLALQDNRKTAITATYKGVVQSMWWCLLTKWRYRRGNALQLEWLHSCWPAKVRTVLCTQEAKKTLSPLTVLGPDGASSTGRPLGGTLESAIGPANSAVRENKTWRQGMIKSWTSLCKKGLDRQGAIKSLCRSVMA